MTMRIETLETPVPVIDLDCVERNLARMQAYCDRHRLRLRPHIKTHKLPAFARRQMDLGACGLTCQKLGEAEIMVEAGFDDILITFPLIGVEKMTRLAALARRARIGVALDNPLALETVARAAALSGAPIRVLIEFDSGNRRTGVASVEDALALARIAEDAEGVRFDGLMTYPSNAASAVFIAAARQRFAAAGLAIGTVSGGGTPGAWSAHEIAGLTEYRVGTYIYNDRATVGSGAATIADCALHVHATVVSRPDATRAVIDAGSKTLSSDLLAADVGTGYGALIDYPEAVIERLSEEHGMIDLSACASRPALGERVRILPNHVCVVTNLHDAVAVSRNGEVAGNWLIAARGRSR